MIDKLFEILPTFGLPGLVLFIIFKSRLVTLLSASTIELKLFSKERRVIAKFLLFLMSYIVTTIILLMVTYYFRGLKYNQTLTTIIVIILFSFHILLMLEELYENRLKKFVSYKKGKLLMSLLLLVYLLGWYAIPAYYFGAQLLEIFNQNVANKINIFITLAIFYFLISLVLNHNIYSTHNVAFNKYILGYSSKQEQFYIDIDSSKWYLFHPLENEFLLLGNHPDKNKCTEFKFIEKRDLLQSTLRVDRQNWRNKNNEGSN